MTDQTPVRPHPLTMENAFARHTMTERIPGILRDVIEANPDYPPVIRQQIERLRAALLDGAPVPMLDDVPVPPPDYDEWADAYYAHARVFQPLTWQHGAWFFVETFLYRHLIQAVRWHETGRDPFAPIKQAELESDRLWDAFDQVLEGEEGNPDRLSHLLLSALWGNRADLSHVAGDLVEESATDDDLLVDDRGAVLDHLASPGDRVHQPVHLVIDNAGLELAVDLALADAFLEQGTPVVVHVKAYPVFVSDTTIPDVWQTIRAMEGCGGRPAALAQRLREAWQAGRLRLAAPVLWTSSRFTWEMPDSLRRSLAQARLVVVKGDVNYRRVVGDAIWDTGVSFAGALSYFPAPLLALRSIKSDALVGVPAERIRAADQDDPAWRTTGRYGVIQFAGPGQPR